MKILAQLSYLFLLWAYSYSQGQAVSLSEQVDYNNIHGFMTISNPLIIGNEIPDNTLVVGAGDPLTLTGDWSITFTNEDYCPNCIIQQYVAWIPRGGVQTGSPNNLGLYSGQIHDDINTSSFIWNTNAPTEGGVYYIGGAQTLQFDYQHGTVGGTGNNHNTTDSGYASYQVNVFGANAIENNETLVIAGDSDLGPAPLEPTTNFLSFDGGVLSSTSSFSLNSNRGITINAAGGSFNPSSNTSIRYSGEIIGRGALTKQGAGALILDGSNSYSGGTFINEGILQGDTDSLQGAINNNDRLVFDQTSDGIYTGIISGSGSLTKQGNGLLTLAGNNTYQGATYNEVGGLAFSTNHFGGTLINDANIIDLTSGLRLSGAVSGKGNYFGHITFAGSFSPGASPALINVENITFADSNTLTMELGGLSRGNQYDAIDASGTVTLGGALEIESINGFVPVTGNKFNLISAQLISNQFENVFCNLNLSSNVSCTAAHDGKDFILQINEILPPDSPLLPIQEVLPTEALDRLTPLLDQPGGEELYEAALTEISPQQQAAVATTSNIVGETQIANITQHLMDNRSQMAGMNASQNIQNLAFLANGYNGYVLPTNLLAMLAPQYNNLVNTEEADYGDLQSRLGIFLNAQFDFIDRDTSELQRGFDAFSYGVTGGFDYNVSRRFLVGLAMGYSNASTEFTRQGGNQTTDSYNLTGFGSFNLTDNWYIDLMANGAFNQYYSTRNIQYVDAEGEVNTSAKSDTEGLQSRYSINTGYNIPYKSWSFGIRGRAEYGYTNINAAQEHGADLGLNVDYQEQSLESMTTDLALAVSKVTSTSIAVFNTQVILEWEHQYLNDSRLINGSFVSTSNSNFTTQTDDPDRDYMNIDASVSAQFSHGRSAFIQYTNRVGMKYTSQQSINVGVRFEF